MAIGTYSDLLAEIQSFSHRDDADFVAKIPSFIALAEADLQVRARLSQWDTSATIALTAGVGALPSDFDHAISVTYSGGSYTLMYVAPGLFYDYAAGVTSGEPTIYTIQGANLRVYPLVSANVTLAYTAKFTPLSVSATTNSLLDNFPDAYLNGALTHACVWARDTDGAAMHQAIFEAAINRVRRYITELKHPHSLQMRAA